MASLELLQVLIVKLLRRLVLPFQSKSGVLGEMRIRELFHPHEAFPVSRIQSRDLGAETFVIRSDTRLCHFEGGNCVPQPTGIQVRQNQNFQPKQ